MAVLDKNGRVIKANIEAKKLLKKEDSDIDDYFCGDVFNCVNAKLPGKCGNTPLCSECTMRNTIMDTYNTGEGHENIPAGMVTGTNAKEIMFYISTERIKGVVLLKIDRGED